MTQQTADIVARLRAGITITLGEEYCPEASVLDDAAAEIERLAAVNADLLAALRELLLCHGDGSGFVQPDADVLDAARAAIAQAEPPESNQQRKDA
jgi:hypothetical protein